MQIREEDPQDEKTAKIEVAIEPEIKNAFMEKLSKEGKKASIEIGLWIREYLKDNKGLSKAI